MTSGWLELLGEADAERARLAGDGIRLVATDQRCALREAGQFRAFVECVLEEDVQRPVAQSWSLEPRGLSELMKAEDLLFHQVWYNRHWNLRIRIQQGKVKLVDKEIYPRKPGAPATCQKDVWAGALRAAKRVEKKYGKRNLGPWDDFEWGMLNGKLSAIRWMLGDEWDMLDT